MVTPLPWIEAVSKNSENNLFFLKKKWNVYWRPKGGWHLFEMRWVGVSLLEIIAKQIERAVAIQTEPGRAAFHLGWISFTQEVNGFPLSKYFYQASMEAWLEKGGRTMDVLGTQQPILESSLCSVSPLPYLIFLEVCGLPNGELLISPEAIVYWLQRAVA